MSPENQRTLAEAIALVLAYAVGKVFDNRKGKRRDNTAGNLFEELTKLKTALIGLDGQNGMRAEVRELRRDVKAVQDDVVNIRVDIGKLQTQGEKP